MNLRQSLIKQYLFCPRSYYYQQVERIVPSFRNAAAVHGTIVHKLIHLLHTENWNLDPQVLYPELLECDEAHIPIFWKDGQLDKFKDEATEMINGYRTKDYNQSAEIIISEGKFSVKLGWAGMFSGTIDQLRSNKDGTFELVDLKTSQFSPTQAFIDNDYQFGIYASALWNGVFTLQDDSKWRYCIPPEQLKITWYHLRDHILYKRNCNGGQAGEEKGDPRRYTSRTGKQLSCMKRDLSKLATCIRRGVFPRNPSYSTCPLCPYAETCVDDSQGATLNRNQQKQLMEVLNAA